VTSHTAGASYIRVYDFRRLLHVLGRGLPHRLVREAAGVLATAVRIYDFQYRVFLLCSLLPGKV
jgi:hypothetical protein